MSVHELLPFETNLPGCLAPGLLLVLLEPWTGPSAAECFHVQGVHSRPRWPVFSWKPSIFIVVYLAIVSFEAKKEQSWVNILGLSQREVGYILRTGIWAPLSWISVFDWEGLAGHSDPEF